VRYDFIRSHASQYPVQTLCRVLEVSKAGYYAWKKRGRLVQRPARELEVRLHVRAAFGKSKGRYGSPRVHEELRAQGVRTSRRRIERLMREDGLCARPKRRVRAKMTDSSHALRVAGNVLDRQFSAAECAGVDRVWVSDITYLPTREGWLYLAVVLDLKSRRVVGSAMSETMETALVTRAWSRRSGAGGRSRG
jgi:transposase InsO family protein